ncbi:Myosin-1 [Spathaspora sp. JA1]|nr:Myosin-1 [Spathaspora sp. JA1]
MDSTSKNWVWIPDPDQLFVKGYIADYLADNKCKVIIDPTTTVGGGSTSTNNHRIVDQSSLESCNPVKFNKCNDMAELTHLNEPSVVYNLYLRYMDDLIYTYSGLFLVAINPYKNLPIYDQSSLNRHHSSDKPSPHIFSIAEAAYRNMLSNKKNQSILVTGESGAGKTENTKKIIQYLSLITSNEGDASDIHSKIIQANPILESFGNAKTIKNNNSSRFGKFIQIYFSSVNGNITGATIDYYLLEKSRVVNQAVNERNYHIFYQFLKGYDNLAGLGLNKDITTYKYLNDSSIDQVDDFKDFNLLQQAFNIMGFTPEETQFIYQVLAIILHLGNVDFTSWKSDQATFTPDSPIAMISQLLGVKKDELVENLTRPKVHAGRELIVKSKRPSEVKFIIDAFAKYLYERLFQFIIDKINKGLHYTHPSYDSTHNLIGVLDIAGFEIFDVNSFEQLCINYTNEKLQQFFNHHSFILEQSEYLRENIEWDYIDFGQDLQPTIDLIETKTPMGIFKLLDEECIMPKSSDQSFMERLSQNFTKTHPKFSENKFKNGFIVHHYAGKVEYDVNNWLQKNTDPVSESIIRLLPNSGNTFIAAMFVNDSHLDTTLKRQSSFKLRTASQKHKDQLKTLMDELSLTEPHFVRCILPNLNKSAKLFDKQLVVNQLRCNGVLEGIRITRAGYPNKMNFEEFNSRYLILHDLELRHEPRETSEMILNHTKLDKNVYKIGLTKIFFKNGILAKLEERRDCKLKSIFTDLQKIIRGNSRRRTFKQQVHKIQSAKIIAQTMQRVEEARSGNYWMELFYHVKPLLEESVKIFDTHEIQENLNKVTEKLKETEGTKAGLEKDNEILKTQVGKLEDEIMSTASLMNEKNDQLDKLKTEAIHSRSSIKDLENNVDSLTKVNKELIGEKEKLNARLFELSTLQEERAKEISQLSSQHTSVKGELGRLQRELSLLEKAKVEELNQLEQLHKGKLSDSQREVARLNQLLSQIQQDQESKSNSEHQTLVDEISTLKSTIFKLNSEIKAHESTIQDLKLNVEKNDSYKAKYDAKINEAKEKMALLKSKVEIKNQEIMQQNQDIDKLTNELSSVKGELKILEDKLAELNRVKDAESQHLSEIERLTEQLLQSDQSYQEIQSQYKNLRGQHSKLEQESADQIAFLTSKLSQLETQEKENVPEVSSTITEEYTAMRLKLNESSALLRREKFENRKIAEELSILKERVNGSTNVDVKRRSVAYGEKIDSSGLDILHSEIEELKLKLSQEQGNFARAETYAIELQKKLNKLQATRGINSTTDYEKKYNDSQKRVVDLESKLQEFLVSSKTFSSGSDEHNSTVSRSESISSLSSYSLRGINSDFVQIYQDITKTLKTTREELNNSKSEILRLKSLLRDSEEELYLAKSKSFRTSISDYETKIANLNVKYENLMSRNKDLSDGVELYKKRAEEYFQKLELAESAVTISKRHEEAVRREMNEAKSQLLLAREEARTSQLLLKEFQSKISNLEKVAQEKKFQLEKAQSEIKVLEEKISYHVKNYENKEVTEKLKDEINTLHKELNFKSETETSLIRDNKRIKLDYEDLLRDKNQLDTELGESLVREDKLEAQVQQLSNSVRKLEDEKFINDRKIANFTKQTASLKTLIEEVTSQRDLLISEKEELGDQVFRLTHELDDKTAELNQTNTKLNLMRAHLQNQREDSEQIKTELNQSKISSTSEYMDQSKLRKELLVTNEENISLKKANSELNIRVTDLQQKLYSNEQLQFWETKVKDLSGQLDTAITEGNDANKTIKNLERTVKQLEIRVEHEAQLTKRYNDENFDYQNKVNHYKSTIDILHQENVDKDLSLKTSERENSEMRGELLLAQKEILELRQRLGLL